MNARPWLLAVAISAPWAPAQAADEPAAGLRATFDAHETAMNGHDLAGVMKLYAPDDKTVVLGTAAGERWVGNKQIEDAYRHFFMDFDSGTLERSCPWVQGDVNGDLGWLAATCEYKDSLKGVPRGFALNVSVVLQKYDGEWRVRAMHFSNPTAP